VGLFQAGSRTGIKVIMALSDQEAILLGSPDQFQNAVLNLCINARDAMPGGGRLRVESSITQGEGHLEGEGPGEIPPGVCYHLSVQDSGMGMSPEVLARCMDPFFTTKREGTGLGLPSVKNAVAELGGGLRITSREGEGCCFNIYLPLAEQGRRSPGVMLASAGVSSLDWFP